TPTAVADLATEKIIHAAVAEGKSAAVTATGKLYTWGLDSGHKELCYSAYSGLGKTRKKQPTQVTAPGADGSSSASAAAGAKPFSFGAGPTIPTARPSGGPRAASFAAAPGVPKLPGAPGFGAPAGFGGAP